METLDVFQRLALALAIGLLVGIERGWQERDQPAGGRTAGIRTFALAGLLGGLTALIGQTTGWVLPAAIVLCFGLAFVVFQKMEAEQENNHSVTNVVSAFVVFALGILAVLSDMKIAAACGVVTATLLAARHSLHGFLRRMTWLELRAALVLLAMTFVALPLLPNRAIDPWGGFNPFELWLLTILIAAISYVGYLAIRIAGPQAGVLFAGAAGGFVSSTAVTLSFARMAAETPAFSRRFAAGATIAGALSLSRATVIATAIAPGLLLPVASATAPAVVVFLLATALMVRRSVATGGVPAVNLSNPFELGMVLKFGALLAVVSFVSRFLIAKLGSASLLGVAAVSGIADLDAITLSAAQLSQSTVALQTAALAILIAAAVNLFTKAVLALTSGTRLYGASLAAVTAIAIACGGAGFLAYSAGIGGA
ncbi:MgtC/SapB family protein [Rhizobium sp. PAMB 3174]